MLYSLKKGSLANEIDSGNFPKISDTQLTFRQLYAFPKCRKDLYLRGSFHSPRVCAKFTRIYYYYWKELPRPLKLHWQNNVQSLVEDILCKTQSTECMHSTCVKCSDLKLNMDDFHNNKESITSHQWIRIDNKIKKSETELLFDEICQEFNNNINVLKKHM